MVECYTAMKMSQLQLCGEKMDDSLKSNFDQHMSKNILWNSIFIKSGKMNLFLGTGES